MKMKPTMSFQELAKVQGEQLSKQPLITLEEAKAQAQRIKKRGAESFAKEAPMIQEGLKLIKTPLTHNDAVHIYRWLCRNQITLEMISKKVFVEFKETELNQTFVKIKGKENN